MQIIKDTLGVILTLSIVGVIIELFVKYFVMRTLTGRCIVKAIKLLYKGLKKAFLLVKGLFEECKDETSKGKKGKACKKVKVIHVDFKKVK